MSADEFHFGVEAFGDAVVAGEAPHQGDFGAPGVEGLAAKRDVLMCPAVVLW